MRRLVPKNLGWKFGSLLHAVLLWLAFSATPDIVTATGSTTSADPAAPAQAPAVTIVTPAHANVRDAVILRKLNNVDTSGHDHGSVSRRDGVPNPKCHVHAGRPWELA